MSEERKTDFKSIRVEPKRAMTRSDTFGTLPADYAKCMINPIEKTCTLTFFQSHPIAKWEPRGIVLESIEDEMVLEVKMPLTTAFGLAIYMMEVFREIREKPKESRVYFGPTALKQVQKDEQI